MNSNNRICLYSVENRALYRLSRWRGLGQRVIVIRYNDGGYDIRLEPDDPMYGIKLEIVKINEQFIVIPPVVCHNEIKILQEKLHEADEFIREFHAQYENIVSSS